MSDLYECSVTLHLWPRAWQFGWCPCDLTYSWVLWLGPLIFCLTTEKARPQRNLEETA